MNECSRTTETNKTNETDETDETKQIDRESSDVRPESASGWGIKESSPSPSPSLPPELPHSRVYKGGYGEWIDRGEEKEWNEWSNFLIEPVSTVETVDGNRMMDLQVHPRHGDSFSATVSPTVFNDPRAFKSQICTRMSTTWYGSQANLNTLKNELGRVEVASKRGTDHLGLDIDDTIWVTPDRNLAADGWLDETVLKYVEQGIVPERAWSCPDDYDRDEVARMLELLPQTRETDRMLPLLGWFYAATLRPYIHTWTGQFNMLFVTGETGSGKTATIETVWEMFGMDSGPFSVTDTSFTMDTAIGCTNSIPIWYDEFKPSDIAAYRIDRFLEKARKATRGGVNQRGNADKSSDQYRLEAPIVVSGEERLHGSAEERRTIFTSFKKASTEAGSETAQAFAELTGGSTTVAGSVEHYDSYDLTQHAVAWLRWVLAQNEATYKAIWTESGRAVDRIMAQAGIAITDLEDLVHQGLQTIHFGCTLYRNFAEEMGSTVPFSERDVEDAIEYIASDSIGGVNRTSHLDTLFDVAARASSAGYLTEGTHYTIVGQNDLRVNLHRALDKIRKYAQDHDLPEDLLSSKSDYDRRIDDVIDGHSYLTCKSQNSPPINRAVGIDIEAAEEAIDGFDGSMFGHLNGNHIETGF